MTRREKEEARMLISIVEAGSCERCGEWFRKGQQRAEVIHPPAGEVIIIHADCMIEGDQIA